MTTSEYVQMILEVKNETSDLRAVDEAAVCETAQPCKQIF
jgi:hypothetical protein